jgi:hypothetical protein
MQNKSMNNESIYNENETRESAADLLRRTREVVKKIAQEEEEEDK